MELVQVERVDALLGPHEDVLVPGLRVDPAGRAVDLQRTPVEHLGEAGTHVDLRSGRQSIGGRLRGGGCSLLRGGSLPPPGRGVRAGAPVLSERPRLVRPAV